MYPQVNFEERTLEGPGIDIFGLIRAAFDAIRGTDGTSFIDTIVGWWNIYSVIAIIFSLLFFLGFIYAKIRYGELSDIEQEGLREAEAKWLAMTGELKTDNNRWSEIERHSNEENPNSWRIAIIEADILLEETLNNAGYVGASMSEKLKSANITSFTTIQDAWEAHKVRNEIAHVGSDFVLTKRIAQETLTRYERVFKEFGII